MNAGFRWSYGHWSRAIIPYVIDDLHFDDIERFYIEATMREINSSTCVKFIPRTVEPNYVFVRFNSLECRSKVGFANIGRQIVTLNRHCMNRNGILHELLHVLGFFHEQNRQDRDDYVIIHWDNIKTGKNINFEKQTFNVTHSDTPYDFASVMHYPTDAWSKNGNPTISPKDNTVQIKADGLSKIDLLQINQLYNCTKEVKCTTPDCDRKIVVTNGKIR